MQLARAGAGSLHNTKVGRQRREGEGRHRGLGIADGSQQRAFAGVGPSHLPHRITPLARRCMLCGDAHQANICNQPQLQLVHAHGVTHHSHVTPPPQHTWPRHQPFPSPPCAGCGCRRSPTSDCPCPPCPLPPRQTRPRARTGQPAHHSCRHVAQGWQLAAGCCCLISWQRGRRRCSSITKARGGCATHCG